MTAEEQQRLATAELLHPYPPCDGNSKLHRWVRYYEETYVCYSCGYIPPEGMLLHAEGYRNVGDKLITQGKPTND